jgi:NADH-quinone oxidoreductase subunit N
MTFDHVALLPAYLAAGTAVLVFVVDLIRPGWPGPVLVAGAAGATATGVAAVLVRPGRSGFCVGPDACSYVWDATAATVAVLFALITVAVFGLSVPLLRAASARTGGDLPVGEFCFLLACSMTGGVVVGAARDLITLIVAVETLTLPLFVLVGLRRRSRVAAEAAVTFYLVSVVSTAVTLLGAALVYASTGAVHFRALAAASTDGPLAGVAVVLILVGLGFKVAAVPLHAWAPPTYDGAPLPVAAFLSTASKLGGVVALVLVAAVALGPWLAVSGPVLAAVAVATMTIGNVVALRQRRMVRLLAWSSVAQAGYILAPLGMFALAAPDSSTRGLAVTAALAYAVFYVLLELGAFGAVIALRGASDGGELADYAGAARRRPWVTTAFVLALAGLAGLPPGLAGLFAKVAVVRALLGGDALWLAVVVALNAVIGLAYYVRAALALFASAPDPAARTGERRVPVAVGVALAGVTLVGLAVGVLPQLVFDALAR